MLFSVPTSDLPRTVLRRSPENAVNAKFAERGQCEVRRMHLPGTSVDGRYWSACSPPEFESGSSHSEAWAGCIVSFTTPTRSSLKDSKSVSSLSIEEKDSKVFLASFLLR